MNKKILSGLLFAVCLCLPAVAFASVMPETPHAPEPISSVLFLIGGGALAYRQSKKRK